MSLGLIITMASVGVGSAIAEKILGDLGKSQEAQYCKIASNSMLVTTAIGCVLEALGQLRRLGD